MRPLPAIACTMPQRCLITLFTFLQATWAISADTNAHTTFSGTVREHSTLLPIPGAHVYFPELHTGTITKDDGTFLLGNLPTIKALVRVSMTGYTTLVETVDLGSTPIRDFVLTPTVLEMHEVVVTGAARAIEQHRQPVPMALVDRDFLRSNAALNIVSALAKVPGISEVSSGPGVSKPYIRGLGGTRVLTLFDGVRLEDQQWGAEHGVEIDPFLIDRVEVIKGPASLSYGSDALAGVVNLLPPPPVPAGMQRGHALVAYNTNNKAMASSAHFDANKDNLVYGLRASGQVAANYRNAMDGRVLGTKYAQQDMNAYLGMNGSWGFARLRMGAHHKQLEVPDGMRDSTSRKFMKPLDDEGAEWEVADATDLNSYRIGTPHQRIQRYHALASAGVKAGDGMLNVDLGLQRSERREFDYPEHRSIPALYLVLDTYTYGIKHNLPDRGGWETTWGLNGMYQNNTATKGTEFLIPSYHLLDAGLFLHAKKTWGALDVSGGLRLDARDFHAAQLFEVEDAGNGFPAAVDQSHAHAHEVFPALDARFTGTAASLGAAWHLSSTTTLKANLGHGFRAPGVAELTANGLHAGEGLMQLGNAALKPESNLQADVGAYMTGTKATFSIELFTNRINNYSYNEKLGAMHGGDSLFSAGGMTLPVFQYRQTRAQLAGGEAYIDLHLLPGLHLGNSISYVQAVNLGTGGTTVPDSVRYLPMIPPLHGYSELRYTWKKKAGAVANLFIKAGLQVHAAQGKFFAAYGTETYTPGYHLFDAGIGGDIVDRKGRTVLTFTMLGTNLADRVYQNNLSRLKYFENYPDNPTGRSGIQNMGRNISITVEVPFQAKGSP